MCCNSYFNVKGLDNDVRDIDASDLKTVQEQEKLENSIEALYNHFEHKSEKESKKKRVMKIQWE